ncbi:helix-turn-helix domain-containing protein [Bradyrhizobium vignae]|uniref:Transposase putative helix-turn-helix domain-containing protein n=1 Tax=Bradyrhizobium vignae TaxID=1549949 RepID=A0A2U3PV28_9BRAD|nr:helix-turn-helix domain-containing protein [Bradyrhizobium vignae]SPP92976.1 protein of unknown function [Bradyrhizobium vignae]
MLLRKAYRYRIYPDAAQEELFRRTIGCCRRVYNLCLEQKNEYLRRRKSLSKFDQIKELTALKEEFDFLYEVPTTRCSRRSTTSMRPSTTTSQD